MPYVKTLKKILKNKAFFKRYQVQKRRRKLGKTDFGARRKMVKQDKHKYNSRKYRLIVRFTNTKCVCQIAYATIIGDFVVAQAISTELPRYGIPCGFKNYAAAYATGLLVARRVLKTFNLDSLYKGKEEINGAEYHVEDDADDDKRPFKCILDVGIRRTSVGARVWAALKGAVDGGLHIPHNTKKFPGYNKEGGEYDAEAHKEKIFGKHVAEYMESLKEEDPDKYETQFRKFIDAGKDDNIEGMYADAHKKIRADPTHQKCAKKDITWTRTVETVRSSKNESVVRSRRITLNERRERVQERIRTAQEKALAEAEEDE